MDTHQKLELLSDASRYDLACACGTDERDRRHRSAGDAWLYPVSLPGGGHSVMLKTLMTNACANDCKYCPLRDGVDSRRVGLSPDEIARMTMEYVRRKNIIGLFLSSGVPDTPDNTMARMVGAASLLRRRYRYRGYIHLKVIPGVSDAAIEAAVRVANSVSINVEAPTRTSFAKLSDRKRFDEDIVRPLKTIARLTARGTPYARVRQTTQFIVGASDETDAELITASDRLYRRQRLERIYFSAYQRGLGRGDIPGEQAPRDKPGDLLTREHRLYQVDFLFRQYKWKPDEIPLDAGGMLSLTTDPKLAWAEAHPERFPVNVNTADREELLRVPGLGPVTVKRLLATRRERRIRNLKQVGVKGKRLALANRFLKTN